MQIKENVSLKEHSTMRLGGVARYVCEITSENELLEALDFAIKHKLPTKVIGVGSNIFWLDSGYNGLLIVNKIIGYEMLDETTLCFGAGMNWDDAVEVSVQKGLSGLEFLSLIPGTVGATPVQNVGAYGSEVKDSMVRLRAYDLHKKEFVTLQNNDCAFGYRTSRFKTNDAGRFIITSVIFKLKQDAPQPPFYEALQVYLDNNNIQDYSALSIRNAVIAIRTSKMPNPATTANNGSFFANPLLSLEQFKIIKQQYPDIKAWQVSNDQVKVSAGWLVEEAGFKDFHDKQTGMSTWHNQNLVFVNEHATTTQQLLDFKQKIVSAVYDKFGIALQQEPELFP